MNLTSGPGGVTFVPDDAASQLSVTPWRSACTPHGKRTQMYDTTLDVSTILLIDDRPDGDRLSGPLSRLTGARVVTATDLAPALRAIEDDRPQAVVSGLPMTDELGLPLLLHLAGRHPELPVVVLSDDPNDALAQQAQWLGARATIARSREAATTSTAIASALGLHSAADVWDRVAEVAAKRHLSLVTPRSVERPDHDELLAGLFDGFGQVRGLRGSAVLAEDGALLAVADESGDLDVEHLVTPIRGLIRTLHSTLPAGQGEVRSASLRTGQDSLVLSCCSHGESHVHVVTLVAGDGNRALVELAHSRLRRLHEVRTSARPAASAASAAEISA